MAFINKIKTNPQLRKTYRAAKTISKKAVVGSTVMCPCGCLEQFEKEKKNQIFSLSHSRHSSDFHSRTKSNADNENDADMNTIQRVMSAYIQNYKVEQTHQESFDNDIKEKIKLSDIDSNPTNQNFLKLITQSRAISRHTKTGTKTLCSCGCNTIFIKLTEQQVFANSDECSDNFDFLIENEFEMDDDMKTSFKIMHMFVAKAVDILKNSPELKVSIEESEKTKKRMKRVTGL